HGLSTCGFTTLLSAFALLGKATEKDGFVTIEIPGFNEIKLKKLKGADDKATDFENRKIFAKWLKNNKEKFKLLSPTLFAAEVGKKSDFDKIIEIAEKGEIEGYGDYLGQEIFGIYEGVKSVSEATKKLTDEANKIKDKGGDELTKEVGTRQDELQQYGIKINWDNITVDDLAILALLSAFLVVMTGLGALALPVAIATFRTLSFEIGWKLDDDGNLNKINNELEKPSSNSLGEPKGKQLGESHGAGVAVA
ncbi:MAG: hypothetical protein EBT55_03455, partial [Proteobacteria bacterium]|nr:hypothetical protein [Pseudomonadota bacterium]